MISKIIFRKINLIVIERKREYLTQSYQPFPIILEGKDIKVVSKYHSMLCKKCEIELKEGDMIIRIGKRPAKYYHKDCFKQY